MVITKWDIFFVDLNSTMGSEQKGKRPVLVISNDSVNRHLPIFTCIPFSSVKEGKNIYPTEVFLKTDDSGLSKDSVLMIHQIRTLSKERIIGEKVNSITNNLIKRQIEEAIILYFDLN